MLVCVSDIESVCQVCEERVPEDPGGIYGIIAVSPYHHQPCLSDLAFDTFSKGLHYLVPPAIL